MANKRWGILVNIYEDQLARDFATLTPVEIFDRHWFKIKSGTTVRGVVESLERGKLLTNLIRRDWRNDGRDKDGLYLIQEGTRFQVFMGERGAKHSLEEFSDLLEACTAWVDWALCQLNYQAPDSKIR